MGVRINLSPEAYEYLVSQIPRGLHLRGTLEQAQLIRSRMNREP